MATVRRMAAGTAQARGAAAAPPAPVRRSGAIREEPARGRVQTSVKDKQGVYDEKQYETDGRRTIFAEGEEAGSVRLSAGLTIGIGQFEFLRVDCSINVPCRDSEAGYEEAYNYASQFVSDKISEEQALWLGDGNQKKTGR